MPTLDRRSFLTRGAAAAGTAAVSTTLFQTLNNAAGASRSALGHHGPKGRKGDGGYGPLARAADQNGDEILALPEGFEYVTFSKIGDIMSDGTPVPVAHDGMAAFKGPGTTSLLIRNHEVRTGPGTVEGSAQAPADTKYDPLGVGGNVTLLFDTRRGRLDRHFVSFAGSIVNCAGGIAYREVGWITNEETVAGPARAGPRSTATTSWSPRRPTPRRRRRPLTAMGRFAHEACATDPRTGIVYQTEDDGNDSGFYRFRPREPRDLTRGGRLEMLAVKGEPARQMITGQQVGESLRVEWVRIDDPDPDLEGGATAVALQGIAKGGALFNRLEGIWYGAKLGRLLLQLHQRRRRRLRAGLALRPPLGPPDAVLRITRRLGPRLARQPARHAPGRRPAVRGRRHRGRRRHPPARPGHRRRQPPRSASTAGARPSSSPSTCSTTPSSPAPPSRTTATCCSSTSSATVRRGSGMTCAITGPWRRGAL